MALRPSIPLNVELWPFDCHIFKAISPNPIPVQYWVEQLANELASQGFNQTDHRITQGHFLRKLHRPSATRSSPRSRSCLPSTLPSRPVLPPFTSITFSYYALALVNCCSPNDALQTHYHATRPTHKSGE